MTISILLNKLSRFRKWIRQQKFKSFYKQFKGPNQLFFDIGANTGHRTNIFLELGVQVVAAEPVANTFQQLSKQFGDHPNVTLLPVALGSSESTGTIHVANHSAVSTLSTHFIDAYQFQDQHHLEWNMQEKVSITTLNQLIQTYGLPDFCKIDVEGYELEVLRGVNSPIPALSLEYNARLKPNALACINQLNTLGNYRYNFSTYETLQFTHANWLNHTDFHHFINQLPLAVETGDIYAQLIT